jgi:DNA (cytosine-5)-methyltransferase 1
MPIPVVDIFAGPGGLGEGFSAFNEGGQNKFRSALSIEKEERAHETLKLRSFLRQFRHQGLDFPSEYYDSLRNTPFDSTALYEKFPCENQSAVEEAQCIELGGKGPNNSSENVDRLIDNAVGEAPFWGLLGGPPCQAYSNMGKARMGRERASKDPRTELYRHYLRILAIHRPNFFIFENVRGISSSTKKGKNIFKKICRDLRNPCRAFRRMDFEQTPNYDLFAFASHDGQIRIESLTDHKVFLIECEKFSIPQKRHRIIIFGIHSDHSGTCPNSLREGPEVRVADVLSGLPKLRSGLSKGDSEEKWRQVICDAIEMFRADRVRLSHSISKVRDIENVKVPVNKRGSEFVRYNCRSSHKPDWYLDGNLHGALNHCTRGHLPMDLYRYLYYANHAYLKKVSPKLSNIPEFLLPKHKNAKSGDFDDRFRVQLKHKASTTVTCHISKDGHSFIHPDPTQCRSLTVREAARLQTFPDNYFFCGPRTSQYVQVGNAVPPLLAHQMAEVVHDWASTSGLI